MRTNVCRYASIFNQNKIKDFGPFVKKNRPKTVVFYCTYGRQRSPEMAYRYLEWLKQRSLVQGTEVANISGGVDNYSTHTWKRMKQISNGGQTINKDHYSKMMSLLLVATS